MTTTRTTKFPAESLPRREVMALLDACGDTWTGIRNKAIIVVMWRSGLRVGEAEALVPGDIDWDAQAIRVRHGKGNKARTVGIDRAGLEFLRQWSVMRGEQPPGTPFFCTRKGHPIYETYLRGMLPRLAAKAGVERRVHPHIFRHTFAVELSREGVPVADIQRLLGHTSLATTSVYLASLSPEESLDRVRGREW